MEIVSDQCSLKGNKLCSKQGNLLAFPHCFFSGRNVNRHPQIFFITYFSFRIVESSKGLFKIPLSYCDNNTHFRLLGFKSKIMIKHDKNLFLRQSRGKKWKSLRNRLGQRKNRTMTIASHNRRISGCYGNHRDLYGLCSPSQQQMKIVDHPFIARPVLQ